MPPYNTANPIPVVGRPTLPPFPLFNAESPTTPAYSQPIQWGGGLNSTKTFTARFASVPSAATVNIWAGDTPIQANMVLLTSMIFGGAAGENCHVYTDTGQSAYYMAEIAANTGGGACTVTLNA